MSLGAVDTGILGIKNRTEDWKTAYTFAPFFRVNRDRLADRLCRSAVHRPDEVLLELFWKGMRDYVHEHQPKPEALVHELGNLYHVLFHDLRGQLENFGRFQLKPNNYAITDAERRVELVHNLCNTEVDVVLGTPRHLFIGEAKHEMGFGADGNLILVHQLVRQYVMARILVELSGRSGTKSVIPFVVGNDVESMHNTAQVQFMVKQGWLKADNVLHWNEIESIASAL